MVRQRTANPLFPSSNLGAASNYYKNKAIYSKVGGFCYLLFSIELELTLRGFFNFSRLYGFHGVEIQGLAVAGNGAAAAFNAIGIQ